MTGKDTEKPKSKFAWNQATWAAGMGPVDQNIGRKEKQHENQLQHESYGKCSHSKTSLQKYIV